MRKALTNMAGYDQTLALTRLDHLVDGIHAVERIIAASNLNFDVLCVGCIYILLQA